MTWSEAPEREQLASTINYLRTSIERIAAHFEIPFDVDGEPKSNAALIDDILRVAAPAESVKEGDLPPWMKLYMTVFGDDGDELKLYRFLER